MFNSNNIIKEKIQKKLKKKLSDNELLVAYLIINLLYLLIGSYNYYTKIIYVFHYKEFSIGLKYLFLANAFVFLVIMIKKIYKKNIVHIGIGLAIVFAIISTIFAFDIKTALEGCPLRYEGLSAILYYLTLFLLSTQVSKKYKKILVNTILICGAVQAIYAICQVFGLFNVKQYFHVRRIWDESLQARVPVNEIWAIGFTNNPNFFGTYMLLCLSYSFGLFLEAKKIYENSIYLALSCLFMFGLLISDTLAVVIGLLCILMYIFIYCLKNKYYEKFVVIFAIILFFTCLATGLGKTKLVKDMLKTGNEVIEISKGNFDDNYGTKRMYIWKNTLKIVPQYLLHGVGIDSFHKAFDGEALTLKKPTKIILYDKAHNEYLQTLVTQGIFALGSYLFIYGYAVYVGTKNAFKNKQIYLVLPIIGYLVQAFFNISVIEVAPLFYMALGLCVNCEEEKIIGFNNKKNKETNNNEDTITVLMTTCNEEKEIFSKALESILKQTYSNIKILIIVDNKENKEIIEQIKEYQNKDNRISYIVNEQNLGLAESLNKGIDIIDTKYIVRMDADDIAFKDRIEKQLKYAKDNPQIDLFGANVEFIDYEGNSLYKRNEHEMNTEKIKKVVKYINIFYHPTFFGKTEIFKKYKYRNIKYSQDYDFICRLLEDNRIVGNMGECLLYYRKPKQINKEKRYIQRISHLCIQNLYKKSKLIDIDLKQYVQESLNKNIKKKGKIIKGFLLHDKALNELKQKKYFKAFFDICHSLFLSKYQLIEISNLIKYEMIK